MGQSHWIDSSLPQCLDVTSALGLLQAFAADRTLSSTFENEHYRFPPRCLLSVPTPSRQETGHTCRVTQRAKL